MKERFDECVTKQTNILLANVAVMKCSDFFITCGWSRLIFCSYFALLTSFYIPSQKKAMSVILRFAENGQDSLHEGDIKLSVNQELALELFNDPTAPVLGARGITNEQNLLWDTLIVPYNISTELGMWLILMNEFEYFSLLNWAKRWGRRKGRKEEENEKRGREAKNEGRN